ncbi:MAG: hypothetical protein KJZ73_13010 [Pseudorhodoplanes sp.]|nr:hypothetical protein [Pseudorhodoplanes sp.]
MGFIDDPVEIGPRTPGMLLPDPARRPRPTFGNVIAAAARSENAVVSAFNYVTERSNGPFDPNHNPLDIIGGTDYERLHLKKFVGAHNEADTRAIMARIDREEADNRLLDAAGWGGTVARIGMGLLDPTLFLPGGAVYRGARAAGAIARTAISVGAAAAGQAALAEGTLYATQETRGLDEVALNIGAATILGGLLGGAIGGMSAREIARSTSALADIRRGIDTQIETGRVPDQNRIAVMQDVRDKLVAAGVEERAAQIDAEVFAARYATRAERLGRDPLELYRGEGIEVRSAETADRLSDAERAYFQDGFDRSIKAKTPEEAWDTLFNFQSWIDDAFDIPQLRRFSETIEDWRDKINDDVPFTSGPGRDLVRIAEMVRDGGMLDKFGDDIPDQLVDALVNASRRIKKAPDTPDIAKAAIKLDEASFQLGQISPDDIAGLSRIAELGTEITRLLDGDAEKTLANSATIRDLRRRIDDAADELEQAREREISRLEREAEALDEEPDIDIDILETSMAIEELKDLKKHIGFAEKKVSTYEDFFKDKLEQADEAGGVRGRITLDDARAVIELFQNADRSTFMHEGGHLFLDELVRDAALAGAPRQIKDDLATTLKWLGVDDAGKIGRAEHEKWARGFEQYLRDGKAPSNALAAAFERFREWLTAIYRSLTDLGQPIPDDIRGVMDRMLATDTEIAARSARLLPPAPQGARITAQTSVHGPVVAGLEDRWQDAVAWLKEAKTGDVRGALSHHAVPEKIDVIWGHPRTPDEEGYGLAKIVQLHPQIVDDLPERLAKMKIVHEGPNRIRLRAEDGSGAVIRKSFNDDEKTWLLTAFEAPRGLPADGDTTGSAVTSGRTPKSSGQPADPNIRPADSLDQSIEATANAADRAMLEAEAPPRGTGRPGSLGAAAAGQPLTVESALGLEKATARLSPVTRLQHSPFATGRITIRDMADAGLSYTQNWDGVVTSAGGTVETRVKQWQAPLYEAVAKMDDAYARYFFGREEVSGFERRTAGLRAGWARWRGDGGGKLTHAEFREEIGKAMARVDQHPIPQVAEAARQYRSVFDNLWKEAKAVGIVDDAAGEKLIGAPSYIMRVYNRGMIVQERGKFEAILRAHFRRELPDLDGNAINELTESVITNILGESVQRLAGLNLIGKGADPRKARALTVPDDEIEPFLIRDIEKVARTYTRSLAADIELARKFGDPQMTEPLQKLQDEYNAMTHEVSGPAAVRLKKDYEAAARDIGALRDRIRQVYAAPADPDGFWYRAGRTALNLNYLARLGGMTISSLPDFARPIMRYGLDAFRDGWIPLITNLSEIKLAAHEVRLAGTALDMVRDQRLLDLADVLDDFGRGTRFERGLQAAADKFGLVSLMSPWNAAMKSMAGVVTMAQVMKAARALAEGKATAKQGRMLAADGIDETMARRIWAQSEASGSEVNGIHLPNTEDWTDAAARTAFRSAIIREVDSLIVTPGLEKPLYTSTPMGRIITQFKSFSFASTQRTVLAGLQQRDAAALTGVMVSLALGALTAKIHATLRGEDTRDWDKGRWAAEALDRSGLLAIFGEVGNIADKWTGGQVGLARLGGKEVSRYETRNAPGALLGPTFDFSVNAAQVSRALSTGEVNRGDLRALRQALPLQNLFYLRGLFDKAETALGDRMGLPERRQ